LQTRQNRTKYKKQANNEVSFVEFTLSKLAIQNCGHVFLTAWHLMVCISQYTGD